MRTIRTIYFVVLWMMILALANRERRLKNEFESLCREVIELHEELVALRQSVDLLTPRPDRCDVISVGSPDGDRFEAASPR